MKHVNELTGHRLEVYKCDNKKRPIRLIVGHMDAGIEMAFSVTVDQARAIASDLMGHVNEAKKQKGGAE